MDAMGVNSVNMKLSYEERLNIPLKSTTISLYTKSGILVSTGYDRIVVGERGPYIEFSSQLISNTMAVPDSQEWRLKSKNVYYVELRTIVDNVKVYYQIKEVDYADYKPFAIYISPFDLYYKNELNSEFLPCIK